MRFFLIGNENGFFISLFESKEHRDKVFKIKFSFYKSYGLDMQMWQPNFNPNSILIKFVPFWIHLQCLPL